MRIVFIFLLNLVCYNCVSISSRDVGDCNVDKPGTKDGQATLFQVGWAYGNACGYKAPNNAHAGGFFAAVGGTDWNDGYGCGTCALLSYNGTEIVVNVVDKCGGCSTGWFDLGGPAWDALTNNALPGHIHNVESRWIECPDKLLGGHNLEVFVKTGSHAWDARFQPQFHKSPITSLSIDTGSGWQLMNKCENFMFCKPGGLILNGAYTLKISSAVRNVDLKMTSIPGGEFVDTKTNNGNGKCGAGNTGTVTETSFSLPPSSAVPTSSTTPVTPVSVSSNPSTTTTAVSVSTSETTPPSKPLKPQGPGNCEGEGLFPDPNDCTGFIKCAQGTAYPINCGYGLYFDTVAYNCNAPAYTNCNGRPVPIRRTIEIYYNYVKDTLTTLWAGVYKYIQI